MGISEKRIPGGAEKIQMSLLTIRKKRVRKLLWLEESEEGSSWILGNKWDLDLVNDRI